MASDNLIQQDINENSGLLSSPGLCGINNSILDRQDDIMNNFLQNLKQKIDHDKNSFKENDFITENTNFQNKFEDENLNKKVEVQEEHSPALNILKQSHFSDYYNVNEESSGNNNQMSQLGQFAQLSYLLNNLNNQKEFQNAAFDNFKNDKSLLKQLQSNLSPNQNTPQSYLANPSQYLLSQLSQQFGVNGLSNLGGILKQSLDQQNRNNRNDQNGNLELDELQINKPFKNEASQLQMSSLLFRASNTLNEKNQNSPITSLPTTNRNIGDLSFKNEELKQEEHEQKNENSQKINNYQKWTNEAIQNGSQQLMKLDTLYQHVGQQSSGMRPQDSEIRIGDFLTVNANENNSKSTNQSQQELDYSQNETPNYSILKKSELFSQRIEQDQKNSYMNLEDDNDKMQRENRWLRERIDDLKISEKYRPINQVKNGLEFEDLSSKDLIMEQQSINKNNNLGQGLNLQDFLHNESIEDHEDSESLYKSMQTLMAEKEKINMEQEKIKQNKFIKMVDRSNAMKSVRSLSRTIDELLLKEKQKISNHYLSKASQSRMSNNQQSFLQMNSISDQTSHIEESRIMKINSDPNRVIEKQLSHRIQESSLESLQKQDQQILLKKNRTDFKMSPGGTTDSLQFSQSITLQNLGGTISGKYAKKIQHNQTNYNLASQLNNGEANIKNITLNSQRYNNSVERNNLNSQQVNKEKKQITFEDLDDKKDKFNTNNSLQNQIQNKLNPTKIELVQNERETINKYKKQSEEDDMLASLRRRAKEQAQQNVNQKDETFDEDNQSESQMSYLMQLNHFDNPKQPQFNAFDPSQSPYQSQNHFHIDTNQLKILQSKELKQIKYPTSELETFRQNEEETNLTKPNIKIQGDQAQQVDKNEYKIEKLLKEKEQLASLNLQLEQKLELKDKQIQNYQNQLQLKQSLNGQSSQQDLKDQLFKLEKELQKKHNNEVYAIRQEYKTQIEKLQSSSLQQENEKLEEENKNLKKENEYLQEAQERYHILQRSFNQLEKNMEQFSDQQIEDKMQPLIEKEVQKYKQSNAQLIKQNEQILGELQKLEILKNEAENSRKDSENLLIEYKKEIKTKEKLLEQLRSQPSQNQFQDQQIINQKISEMNEKYNNLQQQNNKNEQKISEKDSKIQKLLDTIKQLENGINLITQEARNVIEKNSRQHSELQQLKLQEEENQILIENLKEQLDQNGAIHEEKELTESQNKQNQQLISQLKETIRAQKDLIRQIESQTQHLESTLQREREDFQKLQDKFKEQEGLINSLSEMKNKEFKAQQNFTSLERDELYRQIDQLKAVEARQKRKLTQMQTDINDQLKQISEINQKYSKQLESNNEFKKQKDEIQAELSSNKLELSQQKLLAQEKTKELRDVKNKLEQKLIQQDKVLAHKQRQIDDLKDSISLKITVADDLQNLLKQQKQELMETKHSQQEEYRKAKEDLELIRQKTLDERENLLQKLWSSQNELHQLKNLNSQILLEIDNIKCSIKSDRAFGEKFIDGDEIIITQNSNSPMKERKYQTEDKASGLSPNSKQKGRKTSKTKRRQPINPIVAQLDYLKSNFTQKLDSICKDGASGVISSNENCNKSILNQFSQSQDFQRETMKMADFNSEFEKKHQINNSSDQTSVSRKQTNQSNEQDENRFIKVIKNQQIEVEEKNAKNKYKQSFNKQDEENVIFENKHSKHKKNESQSILLNRQLQILEDEIKSQNETKYQKQQSTEQQNRDLLQDSFITNTLENNSKQNLHAASNDSLFTKNQNSLAQKHDSQFGLESSANFMKQNYDLEESVSDILKKFQEDQDKILRNEIAFTYSQCEKEINLEKIQQQEYQQNIKNLEIKNNFKDQDYTECQEQQDEELQQMPTNQKNFQEYIDMFENYVNNFKK